MKFFKRGKKKAKETSEVKPLKFKVPPFDYHPKIIMAWAKGVEGNSKLLDYLYHNGYKELVMATHAIRLKDEAVDWLMKNGYPHFMAMINAAEGNKQALEWLKKNNFMLFYNMALAIESEDEGFKWINKNSTQEIFYLTMCIKSVKEEIERRHNDYHKYSVD